MNNEEIKAMDLGTLQRFCEGYLQEVEADMTFLQDLLDEMKLRIENPDEES